MDFLPSVFGLGAWDDRRWASRIALEKHLFQVDAAVILADARRYHGRRRSLRLEVLPGVAPHGSSLHAKVTLLLFERAVRLIVGSANLTERGYRRNREAVAILTATANSRKEAGLIFEALKCANVALDRWLTNGARKLISDALDTLRPWMSGTSDPNTAFLWTYGQTKLWREFLARWPLGETVKRISIISPFWSENAGLTLSALLKEMKKTATLSADAEVRLLTDAFEGPDGQILPILPPGYASFDWAALGVKATAQAVSPRVLPAELGGMEGFTGSRALHAKVVLMEGSKNGVAYLGSGNFTAHGWGFLDNQTAANVEAGMVIRRSLQSGGLAGLIPEVVGKPVLLSTGNFHSLHAPEQGPEGAPWPEFIQRVLLSPVDRNDDELELLIEVGPAQSPPFWSAASLDKEGLPSVTLISIDSPEDASKKSLRVALSSAMLTRLLTDQEILIRWAACPDGRPVPLNVDASARHRLPISPAHHRVQETDLLFYYQGRISWEELCPDPDQPVAPHDPSAVPPAPEAGVDKSRIQSYQVREFVEALIGICGDLAASTQSESSMRLALLGPVSPLALAQSVRDAVAEGCRTPMAAAFQLVEILVCLKSAQSFTVPARLTTAWNDNLQETTNKISNILKQLTTAPWRCLHREGLRPLQEFRSGQRNEGNCVITRSKDFDLGRDRSRIKDLNDAARQQSTVDVLLDRFFNALQIDRFEIQILADEVGMGKTFVALGLAYSVLAHLKQGRIEADLEGCYQRILVLTPNNHALFRKWVREVEEFKRRCVVPEFEADLAFSPLQVDRLDDLAVALRKPGRQPQVIVARMGLFGGDKLLNYDLKRRLLLGVLFRYWGVSFNYEQRYRLLKGAPNWPNHPDNLTILTEDEDQLLPFTEDQLLNILKSLNQEDRALIDSLLEDCRAIAQPFFRNREDAFRDIDRKLTAIYRLATHRSIQRDFPLLIVDEAHNWKNGPAAGTNGFENFSKYIAPHVRRTLLLTATPFQLRPDEMLEILKVSDFMQPCPTKTDSIARCERLRNYRQDVLLPALQDSEKQSRNFSRAWVRIPPRVKAETLADAWDAQDVSIARDNLRNPAEANRKGDPLAGDVAKIITAAIAGADPDIRQFLKEALYLDAYNARLSRELGKFVIRHRRQTDHRFFRIGAEYGVASQKGHARPDSHILHAAPGLDIRGDAELPQFLLMRCVSEMKNGKGRSSLGSDLTGCYSTLHESAEGRRVKKSLKESPTGRLYLELLFGMVNRRHDHRHPKVSCVVDEVIEHWKCGEKVLIFCFRVNTAERLRDIITDRIRSELRSRKLKCLGGEAQLKTLRARLTGRDRDLVVLGLDRMLWSYAWACRNRFTLDPRQFILEDEELTELARLSLQFGVDLTGERVDRVFLNRATEHVLARRFLKLDIDDPDLRKLLRDMSQEEWIAEPYALQYSGDEDDPSEESSSFDERGCHTIYTLSDEMPAPAAIQDRAEALKSTRQRARLQKQIPLLDSYALAPSLWLGDEPQAVWQEPDTARSVATLLMLHDYLWQLTDTAKIETPAPSGRVGYDYATRALVLQALRRALLRESVLLRLLPQRSDLDESGWGELLARSFLSNLPNQHESMAHRIAVFLEDIKAASGDIAEPSSARGALYEATRLRDQQFVALVKGGGGSAIITRDRIFNGFNTPLFPEVLICTQVGQEGIDLHRHCRHVVHYDLAWNPAVLEQRTGRADRIGSKTYRERDAASDPKAVRLQIGVPFIAGTYDERMYEELRLRAQTFEVLTGGDFAADHADGQDSESSAEGKELGLSVIPLPSDLISDLRVTLQVWPAPEPPRPDFPSADAGRSQVPHDSKQLPRV